MNELELRTHYVDTARSYYGAEKKSAKHLEILDIYNSQEKLPRGYKMTVNDPWCATFVSAMAIKCGLTDIVPTECSCTKMIELHKALGTWQEYDDHVPEPGDLIIYDWDDNGKGDNTGEPDHIGIVVRVTSGLIRVIEGNMYSSVWHRDIKVDGQKIRGYCVPDFAGVSDWETEKKERFQNMDAIPAYARDTIGKLLDSGILRGDEQGNLNLSEDMIRVLVILDRAGKL
jgi:hypothetical protein